MIPEVGDRVGQGRSTHADRIAQRDSKTSVRLWKQYLALDSQGGPNFIGSEFERFRGGGHAATRDVFTADDMVAVSLLSVHVPGRQLCAFTCRMECLSRTNGRAC
ncbi:DUF6308 family protein [Rhodococcoides fascians]|uniref:DUF6308 family protein n=1 Tax=Rhodococcoides fascians TaxID=1828 RepID=UPI001F5E8FF9|nr:DUF6308 family protein [Rhodococcus fascians]